MNRKGNATVFACILAIACAMLISLLLSVSSAYGKIAGLKSEIKQAAGEVFAEFEIRHYDEIKSGRKEFGEEAMTELTGNLENKIKAILDRDGILAESTDVRADAGDGIVLCSTVRFRMKFAFFSGKEIPLSGTLSTETRWGFRGEK